MQVRLVSKSVIEADYVSYLLNELQAEPEFQDIVSQPEGLMAYIARVSSPNPTNQSYAKLLKYCIDHKHWSVFESINLVFEIETSRAISAQILRHRSFCFQEFCLTGDSLISLIKPSGDNYRQSIAELYRLQSAPNYKGKTLRVYDELTQQFTTAPLKEVFHNGVKPVYKVTTSDGKVIKTTKEHKFLTKDGFKSLEDIVGLTVVNGKHAITIKDATIGVNGAQVVPLWQNKEWLKEQRDADLTYEQMAQICDISPHTIKKWLTKHGLTESGSEASKRAIRTKIKKTGKKSWNQGLSGYRTNLVVTEEHKDKIRQARSGSNSNWWKGGVDRGFRQEVWDWTNQQRSFILNKYDFICQHCHMKGGKLELHHVIPVSEDTSKAKEIDNIVPVHKQCHAKIHGKHLRAWQAKGVRNRPTLVPHWVTITSVEYAGKEETYDLEVDHQSHNYVANKIVVHNSQRYQAVDDTGVEIYAARKQDTKNRQNSTDDLSDEIKKEWEARQLQNWKQSFEHYTWALDNNIAKECARMVLPLSTKTKIFMTGNVRNWIHYIELRTANGTQQEHKEIALAIKQIFVQQMPEISTALGWN